MAVTIFYVPDFLYFEVILAWACLIVCRDSYSELSKQDDIQTMQNGKDLALHVRSGNGEDIMVVHAQQNSTPR